MRSLVEHWDSAYADGDERKSWRQARPEPSLAAIAACDVARGAPIVDVGVGSSGLAGELLDAGYRDVSVLDVSRVALELARARLGARGDRVNWIAQDVLDWRPDRAHALWHDRALLHFFVDEDDRRRYAEVLRAALQPGGHVVIATFAPDGPESCSGLPVRRSSADDVLDLLGDEFALLTTHPETHRTPSGKEQAFMWVTARRRATTVDDLLGEARTHLDRVTPAEAHAAQSDGAVLVDIRSELQRSADGEIPGAARHPRNVLEWRLDPSCAHRDPEIARREHRLIIICDEGFQSSLAAATARRFGLDATDVIGGFQAWRAEGLPVDP